MIHEIFSTKPKNNFLLVLKLSYVCFEVLITDNIRYINIYEK